MLGDVIRNENRLTKSILNPYFLPLLWKGTHFLAAVPVILALSPEV